MPRFASLTMPEASHHPLYGLFGYRPPTPFTTPSTLPQITDIASYAAVHRWADDRVKAYIKSPRANCAVVPSPGLVDELRQGAGFGLAANNADARIAFLEIALAHLGAHPHVIAGPLHTIAITPAAFAFRVGDEGHRLLPAAARARRHGLAGTFDIRRLQALARQSLGTIPFVGMVDLALYKNWGPSGPFFGDWVSWHSHLITWGATRAQITAALAGLRDGRRAFEADRPGCYVKQFPFTQLEWKAAYALKGPQKATRYVSRPHEWTSPTTGEVWPPGLWRNKDWLRTGDRVRLLDLLGDRTLDRLFFGNAGGTAIVRAIRAEALAPYRIWERRQPWFTGR